MWYFWMSRTLPVNGAVSFVWWSLLAFSKLGSPLSWVYKLWVLHFFLLEDTCWASWTLSSQGLLPRFCHSCITSFTLLHCAQPFLVENWLSGGEIHEVLQLGKGREKPRFISIILFPQVFRLQDVIVTSDKWNRTHARVSSLPLWQNSLRKLM